MAIEVTEKMGLIYWEEEHRTGEPHYHIYDTVSSTQKEVYEEVIRVLDGLREKYKLDWRDRETIWDGKRYRVYMQVSLVRGSTFPFANRIHINVSDRGILLFRDLIKELGAAEVESSPIGL